MRRKIEGRTMGLGGIQASGKWGRAKSVCVCVCVCVCLYACVGMDLEPLGRKCVRLENRREQKA
jgi:hypothetical protein